MAFNDAKITVYNDSTPAKGATFEAEYQRIYDNFVAMQDGGTGIPTVKTTTGIDNGAGLEKIVKIESTVQNISTFVDYTLPGGLSNTKVLSGTIAVYPFSETRTHIYPIFYSAGDTQPRYGIVFPTYVRVFWNDIAFDIGGTGLLTTDRVVIRLVVDAS